MHGVRVLSAAPPHTPEQQRGFRRMHSCTRLTGTQSARVASCVKIMGHMPIPVAWHAQEERTSPGPDGHVAPRALREGPAALRLCWVQPLGALQQAQTREAQPERQ